MGFDERAFIKQFSNEEQKAILKYFDLVFNPLKNS